MTDTSRIQSSGHCRLRTAADAGIGVRCIEAGVGIWRAQEHCHRRAKKSFVSGHDANERSCEPSLSRVRL